MLCYPLRRVWPSRVAFDQPGVGVAASMNTKAITRKRGEINLAKPILIVVVDEKKEAIWNV